MQHLETSLNNFFFAIYEYVLRSRKESGKSGVDGGSQRWQKVDLDLRLYDVDPNSARHIFHLSGDVLWVTIDSVTLINWEYFFGKKWHWDFSPFSNNHRKAKFNLFFPRAHYLWIAVYLFIFFTFIDGALSDQYMCSDSFVPMCFSCELMLTVKCCMCSRIVVSVSPYEEEKAMCRVILYKRKSTLWETFSFEILRDVISRLFPIKRCKIRFYET